MDENPLPAPDFSRIIEMLEYRNSHAPDAMKLESSLLRAHGFAAMGPNQIALSMFLQERAAAHGISAEEYAADVLASMSRKTGEQK